MDCMHTGFKQNMKSFPHVGIKLDDIMLLCLLRHIRLVRERRHESARTAADDSVGERRVLLYIHEYNLNLEK